MQDIGGEGVQCLACGRTVGGAKAASRTNGTPGGFSGWGSDFPDADDAGTLVASVHGGSGDGTAGSGELLEHGLHRLSHISEEGSEVSLPIIVRVSTAPPSETESTVAWRQREEAAELQRVARMSRNF
ncbi:hypothetical protein LTR53_016529 [Teratosphaeriaceae sp. CCFEE 6253]|nr:hypothetical protein LTR53_016529 [Teratosphaeriaceae sp. CCFEE 6253]